MRKWDENLYSRWNKMIEKYSIYRLNYGLNLEITRKKNEWMSSLIQSINMQATNVRFNWLNQLWHSFFSWVKSEENSEQNIFFGKIGDSN